MSKGNRKKIEISLPKNLIDEIKKENENVSEYIENLVEENHTTQSSTITKSVKDQKSTLNPQALESLGLEVVIDFLKNYRKKEWIDYILETRGEGTIRKEARRFAARNPEDWSNFSEEL